MHRVRFNVVADFLRTIFASLMVGLIWSGTAMLVVLFLAHQAGAEEIALEKIEKLGDAKEGRLVFKSNGSLLAAPTLKTDVHMRITGMIARVKVEQHFKNPTKEWMEGIYVFPLPEESAVDHLDMKVGERVIEGQIKEKEEAKKAFETAKREGKKATLLEQERSNILTTKVANIGPQEEITVTIEYQETLRYDQGQFRVRFPMVVAPRYIPGTPMATGFMGAGFSPNTDQVPDASRITPPVSHPSKGLINPVSIKIDLDAGFQLAKLESLYHQTSMQQNGQRYSIQLADGETPANRDFELVWKPEVGDTPQAAVFTETKNDKTYALIMVMPPSSATSTAEAKAKPMPREVIFVIDTSGSMDGMSIEQAREALALALGRLTPRDRFNVIQFNSYTSKLYPDVVPVNSRTLREAQDYARNLRANGGTEIAGALDAALIGSDDPNVLRQVVFMTDGSVGNEQQLFDIIRKKLGDSRLFTIGIGSAPNSYFMTKAAQLGRGTFTYIGKVDEVKEKMASLFAKLESPVLKGVQVAWPQLKGGAKVEAWPQRVPDLYLGEPIVISAALTTALSGAEGEVQLSGMNGDLPWKASLPVASAHHGSGMGVLWAREKIGALVDTLREGKSEDEVRPAVVQVALEHHLVSKYTSLVAVDKTPVRRADDPLKTAAVPGNLPDGQVHEAFFGEQQGELPQGATDARVNLMLGMLLLLMASVLWHLRRRVAL
jgi:Ca-activated chloride channel homolog